MNIDNLCMGCMNELNGETQCKKCGHYADAPQIAPYLPLKTVLGNRYIIGKMLNANSEGASYMAYDTEQKAPVIVREYLPEKFIERSFNSNEVKVIDGFEDSYYTYLKKFLDMWRKLARMRGLSALIPVIDIIEENNTAYAVREYFESISLREFLLKSPTGYLNWDKAKILFMPVLSTLSTLHSLGIAHYGINPDNLLIGRDGKLRLSGFCIAETRLEGTDFTPEIFEGYSAIEQYSCEYVEGNWTDVYSFCAVVYRALVGTAPQDALSRVTNDRLIIPARYAEIIPVYVINALINGLQVDPQERTKDIEALREELSATPSNVVSSFSGLNVQNEDPKPTASTPQSEAQEEKEESNGKLVLITFLIILGVGLIAFAGWLFYDKVILESVDGVTGMDAIVSFIKGEEETTEEPTATVETFVVEKFEGFSYDAVTMNPIQNERFVIMPAKFAYSSTVPEGRIISQSITAGTEVPMGTKITFVVSQGPEIINIPRVVGYSKELAVDELKDAGFEVKIVEIDNYGGNEEGVVESISPGEGERREKGTTVTINVWGPSLEVETTTEPKNPYLPF